MNETCRILKMFLFFSKIQKTGFFRKNFVVVVVPLGAGVAGLSAIATAHSLGCKVHVLISMGRCGKHNVFVSRCLRSVCYHVFF